MREMKDSGIELIGQIPTNKKVLRNKYKFIYTKGKLPSNTNLEGLGVPYIGATDLDSNTDCMIYTQDETLPDAKLYDLLILWDGARAGLCGTYRTGKISSTIMSVKADHTVYAPFLFWYYKAFESFMYQRVDGTTIPHMSRDFIEDIGFVDWTLDEQHHMTDYLNDKCTKIDAIISRQQEVIEKLKAYKLSTITEAVTIGLNPDVKMKDSGIEWIGEIPVHWKVIKLKYATKILRGKFNHRPRNDPAYYDGPFPFVQTGDVARAEKYITSYSQTLNELGYSVSKEFPKGSIVMTIAANVGDVAVLDFKACFPDSVVGYVPSEKIRWNYLYYTLKAMKSQLIRNAIISTQLNLNIEIIKEEFIAIAPLSEQQAIIDYLDTKCEGIDSVIMKKTFTINKFMEYKKSLIYEVVTGKKEI